MEFQDKDKIPPFIRLNKLKTIGEEITMKVYVGQNDSVTKTGTIVKIYDKGNYNMLLCKFKSKKGNHTYHSCTIQRKDNLIIYT